MATANLPIWPGAAHCYSLAYRILAGMASAGHVKRSWGKCYVSQEMRDFIKALDSGDEEQIKANNHTWLEYADVAHCKGIIYMSR